MSDDASGSPRTLLIATLCGVVAFCFFEHTTWLVLAALVLLGYCGRAFVHQSQPEIAQMQMHDMVDHTALHPQPQQESSNTGGEAMGGSASQHLQRPAAPAQTGSVGNSIDRQQHTVTAKMPTDNISSEQFSEDPTRGRAAPMMPDGDFTFPDVQPKARPAIQPLQPMQHMDPMQEQPPPSQESSYSYQAPQSVAPQVTDPGARTISQTMNSQVSNSSDSYAMSRGNQPSVHQYQASGTRQERWSSEVGDGRTMTSNAGGSTSVYGQPAPTASEVPLLPDGFSLSSDSRQV